MINVDILSPVGGCHGGVENVIRAWLENLPGDRFHIRVIHMTPGAEYLKGFHEIYNFDGPKSLVDIDYYADKYGKFIKVKGAPDVCVSTNWPIMAKAAALAREATGKTFRILSWVHNNVAVYESAGYGGFGDMLHADGHICINNQVRDGLLRLKPDAMTYVVGNPVKLPETVEAGSTVKLSETGEVGKISESYEADKLRKFNIMAYVGRLEEAKRVDIILEAMYRAKSHWRLKIIGTGSLEDELKECVKYLNLENDVEFYGWQENPWECCADARVCVFASEYEGNMMSGVEAMAHGMMIVSTPVDGLVDYLVPGVNGYLYNYEDAVRLAEILDMLSDGSLSFCDGESCRKSVEWYSLDKYMSRVEAALEDAFED